MTEEEWLRQINLFMDHNDNWGRAELARYIFLTERKNRRELLDHLNEGHPDGPFKEKTDESNRAPNDSMARWEIEW